MVFGRGQPCVGQPFVHPFDHIVVFRVYHRDGTVFARDRQNIQHTAITDIHQIVGHENLEGCDPAGEGTGQLLVQHFRGRVGDDQVVTIINDRSGPARIVRRNDIVNGLAAMLRCKRDEG